MQDGIAIVSQSVEESDDFAYMFELQHARRYSSNTVTRLTDLHYLRHLVFVLPSVQSDDYTMTTLRRSVHTLALVRLPTN